MPDRKVTLNDLARLAGVSTSTVSRALADSPQISAEMKQHIQAIAREHHYQPHQGARNLRLKKSNVVAVVLPIAANDAETFANPFVLEFLGAVGLELRHHGCHLLLLQERELNPWFWRSGLVDGYLQLGHGADPQQLYTIAENLPLVVWGPALPGQPYCSVGIDNQRLAQQAVTHLLRLGRRRIGIISGTFGNQDTESYLRFLGYEEALRLAGIPVDPSLLVFTDPDSSAWHQAALHLVSQVPDLDAVFAAYGDVVALVTIEALRQTGRRVPEDVAVVGFDNIALGGQFGVPLTTVSQEVQFTGARVLVETLMKRIAGQPVQSVTIPGKLLVRKSCGAFRLNPDPHPEGHHHTDTP